MYLKKLRVNLKNLTHKQIIVNICFLVVNVEEGSCTLKNFKPLSEIVLEICFPKIYEINIVCIGTS